jgi:hypothetical protein
MPPVDDSHQILLTALEALPASQKKDSSVHVLYNGGEPFSRQAGRRHPHVDHHRVPIEAMLPA